MRRSIDEGIQRRLRPIAAMGRQWNLARCPAWRAQLLKQAIGSCFGAFYRYANHCFVLLEQWGIPHWKQSFIKKNNLRSAARQDLSLTNRPKSTSGSGVPTTLPPWAYLTKGSILISSIKA